ncbi:MAG: hydroxymethylbilane synthase [Candidatus Omnitrophica bacterium]|nr:hydroxymethylbilane synthase [Candidatus Omnitrophota bacterium]
MNRLLRIGTRGSPLALAQAAEVKQALEKGHPGLSCELVVLKVSGDDFTVWKGNEGVPLKGLFVKEIEEALLKGSIELAVHSAKDLQADLPAGLKIAGVLPRKDPRDALVGRDGKGLADLPANARIGVSSLRRQSQLKRLRRDLELLPIRGNVDTRLKKLDAGEYDALVLAVCGLIRLGRESRITEILETAKMMPAPGQGALAVEIREDNQEVAQLLQAVNDPDAETEVEAERAFLKALGGGCSVPVGGLARVEGENLTLTGAVFSPDGLKVVREQIVGPRQAARRIGTELASHLRAAGADRLLYGQWKKPVGA